MLYDTSQYFKEIQARKERSNMLYDTSQYSTSSALMTEEVYDYDEDDTVMINYYVGIITIRMKTFFATCRQIFGQLFIIFYIKIVYFSVRPTKP